MKKSNKQNTPDKKFQGIPFMLVVVAIYIILYFVNSEKTLASLKYFAKNTRTIIPIFLVVILLTAIINFYFPKERISKMFQNQSAIKTYLISLIAGIISHGPVFAWFPLLKNLQDKGVPKGSLVTFFYARSIKLTLLPVMIGYFGQLYTIIFMIYIGIAAILQGVIYQRFIK